MQLNTVIKKSLECINDGETYFVTEAVYSCITSIVRSFKS